MGVSVHARRLFAMLALGLTLVLAGSASPLPRSDADDAAAELPSAPAVQAPASMTDVHTRPAPPAPSPLPSPAAAAPEALPPAVRVAAARAPGDEVAPTSVSTVLLTAYRVAAASVPASCNLRVSLLAAIGQVESGSLVGDRLDARHRTSILGPVLDGHGFAAIPDTDNGRWDGDTAWDRAVGPMQFVPSTWRTFGVDGDGDGVADPQDVEDSAASAAVYLCYGGRDLAQPAMLRSAILSYNHSTAYERLVLTYQQRYARLGLDQGMSATGIPLSGVAVGTTPVSGLDLSATMQAARASRPGRPTGHQAAPSVTSASAPVHGSPDHASPVHASPAHASPVHASPAHSPATPSTPTRPGVRPGVAQPSLSDHSGTGTADTDAALGSTTSSHPSVKPSVKPSPNPLPRPTPTPTATATPTPTATATEAPVAAASPSSPTGTATATPSPTGTPTAAPTPTGTPIATPGPTAGTPTATPGGDPTGAPVTCAPGDPVAAAVGSPSGGSGGTAPVCDPQAATEPSSSSAP